MKTVFAYIRVSTHKQGSEGASLPEQKDSIQRFCERNNLHILRWFEEQETAAKRGRKEFSEMLKLVKKGKAQGLVFHKIDRSTRNLFEWAEVSSLPEQGIEVHYSHEPVDLTTTHGRTAADVAAVFAASYIRNLREEVKKGLQGRLKQGIYPFRAPVGYLDMGKAKLKEIDPIKGPLVRKLFERYATGNYSLKDIVAYGRSIGLLGTGGNPINLSAMSVIFRNSFYTGLITIKRTGETYVGEHAQLISPALFKQVQRVLDGRIVPRKAQERYLFQKLLKCTGCGYSLIAERQKGHLYYRCHTCKGVCLRETEIERVLGAYMHTVQLPDSAKEALRDDLRLVLNDGSEHRKQLGKSRTLQIANLSSRIDRLTDAYLEGALLKDEYEKRKAKLLAERLELEAEARSITADDGVFEETVEKYLELAIALPERYFSGNPSEKRDLLKFATSNLSVSGKTLAVQWRKPFQWLVGDEAFCNVHIPQPDLEGYRTRPHSQDGDCAKGGCPDCDQKNNRAGFIAAIIEAARHPEYIGPEFPPPPPPTPSNTTWRENFRKRPS